MRDQDADREIFKELINSLEHIKAFSPSESLVLETGKLFLGATYGAGTLETEGPERLVINLREVDCFTFIENVVALASVAASGRRSFEAFQKLLLSLRYRGGRLRGYSSRLHYFSDWIHDNEKKGIVRDVTAEMGGNPFKKPITFMTRHPALYPKLTQRAELRKIRSVEKKLSARVRFFIPKEASRRLEDSVREGDVIAITTEREGLDVQHAGFAAKVKNRIHLLHASSREGKVVLSKRTLYGYLMQRKDRSGILVARISSPFRSP